MFLAFFTHCIFFMNVIFPCSSFLIIFPFLAADAVGISCTSLACTPYDLWSGGGTFFIVAAWIAGAPSVVLLCPVCGSLIFALLSALQVVVHA